MKNDQGITMYFFLLAVWERRGGDSYGRRPVSRVGHLLWRGGPRVAEGIVLVDGVEDEVAVLMVFGECL